MSRPQLFVDGQVLQTTARDRGMGRYCICLLSAIIQAKTHDVTIIFSKHLPLEKQNESELKKLFTGSSFVTLDLLTTKGRSIDSAFKHNTETLNNYLQKHATEDATFFIPALFQEPLASVFPSRGAKKALLFHDLIPYLYHMRYQPVMQWENYLKRFKYIFDADVVLTNSQTVADDLAIYLGVPKAKLHRIDGAAIHIDAAAETPELELKKPFILCNTSNDPRKNNLRTVLAFEEFRRSTGLDYDLVLTSYFSEREREQLQRFSKHLKFTGSVHERQINWLYKNCELVLCMPESEGLGLPVLEAVDAGKKVVCSSISVLREISPAPDAFYFCDYQNSYAIAQTIQRALADTGGPNTKAYKAIRAYYSWPKTAERMLAGIKNIHLHTEPKPKIAIVMATPNGASGVGISGAILYPTLADHFDIHYYFERGLSNSNVRPNYLQYVVPCLPATSFSALRYAQYDAVFYHIGNGDYHLESITSAFNMPGNIIVHDTMLVEAFRVMRETGMMTDARDKLEQQMDKARGTKLSSHYTSLANRQLGILVHSGYAEKAMQEVLDAPVPVVKTNLSIAVPESENLHDNDRITIGLAGAIADVKGLDVIEAIAEDPQFADCNIRLFGFNHASPEKLAQLDAYDNVQVAVDVSDYDFQTSFSKLDIFVNYRLIYKGETSNTTLEAMRQGVVSIVRNVGWYAEQPDDVVVKVENPEQVIAELRKLVKDREKLRAIGKRAKEYVSAHFTADAYAAAMKVLMERGEHANDNPNLNIAKALRKGRVKNAKQLVKFQKKGKS